MHGRFLIGLSLVVAAIAILFGHPLLWRLGYTLIGLLFLAYGLTWTSVRKVDISRRTRASRAEVGSLAEENFAITNRSWLPKLWLEVRDQSDLPGHHASRVVSAMAPGATRRWSARTVCRRRGMFRLGPMQISGGDPLGVFRRDRRFEETAPFIVYPRSYELRGLALPTGYLSGGAVVRRRSEQATTNVRGVRGYQAGDGFNRIHWPTSARRGQLYTREFELDPIADYWILLDLDRETQAGERDAGPEGPTMPWLEDAEVDEVEPNTEEYLITAAASLARHFLASGKSVGLIAHGQRRIVTRPDRGDRQLGKIMTHLAVLRATGRAGLSDVLSAESHELKRHATLVVVTATSALRWVDALRGLRQRGVYSMAVVVEASSFGPAGSSEGVIGALAASHVLTRVIRRGDHIGAALEQG
jgi:uncharacterized protein (DUF58 family)